MELVQRKINPTLRQKVKIRNARSKSNGGFVYKCFYVKVLHIEFGKLETGKAAYVKLQNLDTKSERK